MEKTDAFNDIASESDKAVQQEVQMSCGGKQSMTFLASLNQTDCFISV